MCRLLHYAIGLEESECVIDEASDKGNSKEPPQKKQKKGDPVTVSWHVYYIDTLKVMLARQEEISN